MHTAYFSGHLRGGEGGCQRGGTQEGCLHREAICLVGVSAWRGVSAQGGCLPGGGLPGGVCLGRGCLPREVYTPLWTEWLIDMCKSITFPQLRLRAVISPNAASWLLGIRLLLHSFKSHTPQRIFYLYTKHGFTKNKKETTFCSQNEVILSRMRRSSNRNLSLICLHSNTDIRWRVGWLVDRSFHSEDTIS